MCGQECELINGCQGGKGKESHGGGNFCAEQAVSCFITSPDHLQVQSFRLEIQQHICACADMYTDMHTDMYEQS